ncbi:tetratricopeptide repeat protein [Paraglaciecola sp. 2405UD69-4]|uniref:tetratricopeptide repeat protein n=1 Tax=Paraglaciecola sp. 2405UD69-4 TaxID=3391836 RepID=UPI0039C8DB5E
MKNNKNNLIRLGVMFVACLGMITFHTNGAIDFKVDPDLSRAIDWYTGVTGRVDDVKAKALLDKAALKETPLAVMWIARVHSTGRMGYSSDKGKAMEIAKTVIDEVEKLAASQIPEALFLMGTAYAEGLGKSLNPEQAVVWYRRAAVLGNVLAQHNLGNAYAFGKGVDQSDELAIKWWLMAAEQGDAIPQYQLGLAYEKGKGVATDLNIANTWYQNSAARGYAKAKTAIKRLNRLNRLKRD